MAHTLSSGHIAHGRGSGAAHHAARARTDVTARLYAAAMGDDYRETLPPYDVFAGGLLGRIPHSHEPSPWAAQAAKAARVRPTDQPPLRGTQGRRGNMSRTFRHMIEQGTPSSTKAFRGRPVHLGEEIPLVRGPLLRLLTAVNGEPLDIVYAES